MRKIQVAITLSALVLVVIHVVFPHIAIDYITLTLIFIAVIPWLVPLFKSMEFPGGWKVEFQQLEKVTAKVEKAGLLANEEKVLKETQFSFETAAQWAVEIGPRIIIALDERISQSEVKGE